MSVEENKEINEEIEGEQKIYELGFLLVPALGDEKMGSESDNIRNILEASGKIISSEAPKTQELEYDMDKVTSGKKQHFSSAYFGFFIFETEANNIEKIKKELDKNDNILRFLMIVRTKDSLVVPKRKTVSTSASKSLGIGKQKVPVKIEKIDEKELDKTIDELVSN